MKKQVKASSYTTSRGTTPVELSISLSEADGERVFVSFLRDITRELQAEEDLRSARDKAQESEKAKSDLLTVMSHEMRTPLNGILGSLSLIDQSTLDDRQKRHLNSISVSGDLLLSHVNDVLDLSSPSPSSAPREKVEFNLGDMVHQLVESLNGNAESRGNTLTVNCLSEGLGTVVGSKRSLQQILVNLLGNAIKFTRDGIITLELERVSDSDLVELRVSDTGVGIAPDNLDRIFEEFVTIDTAFSRTNAGTGLGLPITKRLVDAMGGEIEADSLLGEGSLFTLRIPLPAQQTHHSTPSQATGDGPAHIPFDHTALVVDDNDINRMIMRDLLEDLGFAVSEATDGFDALRLVSKRPFDVVLMDISMPGIDGVETLRRIRRKKVAWRDLPAIAVTAHASRKDHETILQAPFADLLVKPVNPEQMRNKLAAILSTDQNADHAKQHTNARDDFRKRFGEEKYRETVMSFAVELDTLLDRLNTAPGMTDEIRQGAHRLAGTAAVLGEDGILAHLQEVEQCSASMWPDAKRGFHSALSKLRPTLP